MALFINNDGNLPILRIFAVGSQPLLIVGGNVKIADAGYSPIRELSRRLDVWTIDLRIAKVRPRWRSGTRLTMAKMHVLRGRSAVVQCPELGGSTANLVRDLLRRYVDSRAQCMELRLTSISRYTILSLQAIS